MDNSTYLDQLRHSCSHLLAAAVLKLYPDAKPTLGPAIENGFYYDFDFSSPISDSDLPQIEKAMHELVKSWDKFSKSELKPDEAKEKYAQNEYKQELIDEHSGAGETLTFYQSGDFVDLCRGGHIENPSKELKHFKLLSVAGAYWHGDEKNKMLTRIYGTAFPTKAELDDYLRLQEEAKRRDHRKLGKELDLFAFSDLIGKGLPMLTSKGTTIRRELERFIVDEELKRGYEHVITPPLAKVELYKTSGHYPYYKDTMYPTMKIDEEELILRPMTCPHHFMLFKNLPKSYREMPVRYAEISPQFRYEKSGELTGLIRVRMFMLADAHIITPKDQAKNEVKSVLNLIDYVNETLGLKKGEDYRYRLSLGERKDTNKYYQDDTAWDLAENSLRDVLQELKAPFYEAANEAAFYGPKIDVQMKNVNGKEDTAFTVQYDFVMPKRFKLEFINSQGKPEEPVVIHRASLGCFERTMAFLIEHFAGAFPLWLSPVQAAILPIGESHQDFARKVFNTLKESNIRAELWDQAESLGKRIRNSEKQKIPYMLIIGDKEMQSDSVALRVRGQQDRGVVQVSQFITQTQKLITTRSLEL